MTVIRLQKVSFEDIKTLALEIIEEHKHIPGNVARFSACLAVMVERSKHIEDPAYLDDMYANFDSYWAARGINMFDDFEEKQAVYAAYRGMR